MAPAAAASGSRHVSAARRRKCDNNAQIPFPWGNLSEPVAKRLMALHDPNPGTIVQGAGFGSDSQLTYNGVAVPILSISPTEIAAVGPSYPLVAQTQIVAQTQTPTNIQVLSGGGASNPVLVAGGGIVSPGLYSADGSGIGQAYALNQDGTRNGPSNPAAQGSQITVFANGVGPVSFSGGYAIAEFPEKLYIDGILCNQVSAMMGPVAGLPGDVYQLTAYVPILSAPNYAPRIQQPVTLNGGIQAGLTISVSH
jgi:uncharacterized protein (TIGR03437 family)